MEMYGYSAAIYIYKPVFVDPGSIGSLNVDPDSRRPKWPPKRGKNEEMSCFKELDVFFWRLRMDFRRPSRRS
jgi:hypothetical protein